MKNFFSLFNNIDKNSIDFQCVVGSQNFVKQTIQENHISYHIEHKKRWSRSNRLRKSLCKNITFFQNETNKEQAAEETNILRNKQISNLQGLLKTRKSHLKKLKFQQYYVSSEKNCDIRTQNAGEQNEKSQTQIMNVITSKVQNSCSLNFNNQWFNKKRVLPIKLRAKSHTDFTRKLFSEKSFSKQQSCNVLAELTHLNIATPMPILSKNKIRNSTRMRNNSLTSQSKTTNLNCFSQKQLIMHREKLINKKRGQNVNQKNKQNQNEARKKMQEAKILKKNVKFSFQDNFKLSPWQNKAAKQDKQNYAFL